MRGSLAPPCTPQINLKGPSRRFWGLVFLSERIEASIYIEAFRLQTLRQVEPETAQTDPPEVQAIVLGETVLS